MKNKHRICSVIIPVFTLLMICSCRKEEVPPTVVTSKIIKIIGTAATGGGTVTDEGSSPVLYRGICWNATGTPTIADSKTTDGSGAGLYISNITGLNGTTTYYVRAYASNSTATSYGNEVTLKTYTGTVSDIEGNVYNTIAIGTQVWMAENLKTTKFNNGNDIPLFNDNNSWAVLSSPGYCWYNYDAATVKDIYGALYNWYAVNAIINSGKNICPVGWHVPTDEEWTTLSTFLGGEGVAGGKMKETGLVHWQSPNTGATNESGFTGLPGGGRYFDGTFSNLGITAGWWSSTELLSATARGRYLYYDFSLIYRGYGSKKDGFSVRCIRD